MQKGDECTGKKKENKFITYADVGCCVAVKMAQVRVRISGNPQPITKYNLWYVSGRKTITINCSRKRLSN